MSTTELEADMTTTPGAFLDRHPRARAAVTRVTAAGGERAASVDKRPGTRRVALRSMPQVLQQRFVPEAAAGLHTVYELRVLASGGGGEERFTLIVDDGQLTVEHRAAPEAAAWVAVSLADMIRMVSGSTGVWPLMAAKRLEVGGDVFTAMRFPSLFGF